MNMFYKTHVRWIRDKYKTSALDKMFPGILFLFY